MKSISIFLHKKTVYMILVHTLSVFLYWHQHIPTVISGWALVEEMIITFVVESAPVSGFVFTGMLLVTV